MRLGFIGTGTITAAMVDGVMASQLDVPSIIVSPRNAEIANRLANDYNIVKIAHDNQSVIDESDVVFLCLRSQIAKETIQSLRFRDNQVIVSVLAMVTAQNVEEWIGQKVYRAVPLPFVSECKSITPIYPDHPFLRQMFNALGGTFPLNKESDFNSYMAAGSLMGVYFHFMETSQQWLQKQGLSASHSKQYLATLFGNLADEMRKTEIPDFVELEKEFSTKGGTNELVAQQFVVAGGAQALSQALDQALEKIKG